MQLSKLARPGGYLFSWYLCTENLFKKSLKLQGTEVWYSASNIKWWPYTKFVQIMPQGSRLVPPCGLLVLKISLPSLKKVAVSWKTWPSGGASFPIRLKRNIAKTLEVAFFVQFSWNLLSTFVLMISRQSSKLVSETSQKLLRTVQFPKVSGEQPTALLL